MTQGAQEGRVWKNVPWILLVAPRWGHRLMCFTCVHYKLFFKRDTSEVISGTPSWGILGTQTTVYNHHLHFESACF